MYIQTCKVKGMKDGIKVIEYIHLKFLSLKSQIMVGFDDSEICVLYVSDYKTGFSPLKK